MGERGREMGARDLLGDTPTDPLDLEADLGESGDVEDSATVKDERGLDHRLVDLGPVERLELVPL